MSDIASTIKSQIGVGTFMTLGAHQLARSGDDFIFAARIIPTGQSAARIMQVRVHLNPMDLYDIKVTFPKRGKFFESVTHFEATDVDAESLNGVLFRLDREG
jgi:hypothetical protein